MSDARDGAGIRQSSFESFSDAPDWRDELPVPLVDLLDVSYAYGTNRPKSLHLCTVDPASCWHCDKVAVGCAEHHGAKHTNLLAPNKVES